MSLINSKHISLISRLSDLYGKDQGQVLADVLTAQSSLQQKYFNPNKKYHTYFYNAIGIVQDNYRRYLR